MYCSYVVQELAYKHVSEGKMDGLKWRNDEEEDVFIYWMNLRNI